ncbi:MAG: PAS domain S-box protein, partial [Candidatus Omnitrophota bacterium]
MERVGKHVKELLEEVVAQEEVQRSERLYSALVEKSFDGVFAQKGPKIIFANKRLCELLGYEKDELKGMDYWLLYHPDYQNLIREQAEASLRGEKVLSQYEVKLQRKDGSLFDGEINASVVSFEGGLVVQVLVRDITEQKQAEEEKKKLEVQLRQANKMDAISTLAGGIAHDFNNLLMGIQGNASLMLLDIDPGHPYYKRLKNIE